MAVASVISAACAAAPQAPIGRTMDQVLAASKPEDWRTLDPNQTLYVDLPSGQVVIELAPQFAPRHVDNIRTLVRERYFDGMPIVRVQDNFVVQWGDTEGQKPIGTAKRTLAAEFTRPLEGLAFRALPDPDTYAPETGFVAGFPAARDAERQRAWPTHCYGMVGAGRDTDADSGGGHRVVRRERPRAAPARPQHHAGRPRGAGHGAPRRVAPRHRPDGLL